METISNSKVVISILTLLLLIAALAGYYFLHEKNNTAMDRSISINTLPVNTSTTSGGDVGVWKTYNNTAFHYWIKYPENSFIQPIQEMETPTTTESSAIEIFTPGSSILGIRIIAWIKYPEKQSIEFPVHNQLLALDLETFAKKLRQNDIDDKNPNFPNKKIGELITTIISGEKAYIFNVSGSMDGYGHTSYYRLLTEHNGIKFEIKYPKDELASEQVIKTFSFTK